MKRSRWIPRDFDTEGRDTTDLALALAQLSDRPLLESLLQHLAAIREFGGEMYVGAVRQGLDHQGEPSKRGPHFVTVGYITAYNKKAQIPKQEDEPDIPYGTEEPPLTEEEAESLGEEIDAEMAEQEPVEA